MRQQLSRPGLEKILQHSKLENLSDDELLDLFRDEIDSAHRPHGRVRVDPRSGHRVVYSTARSIRPDDYLVPEPSERSSDQDCIICQGSTTGVIDVAELSEGFTFINKNLYPAFFPFKPSSGVSSASGLHLLQWTSSHHDTDWHNLMEGDGEIVMARLAELERSLLSTHLADDGGAAPSYVSIFKNFGSLVGSSLSHGHQQIVLSNVEPGSVAAHRRFEEASGETFSEYMLREAPEDLIVVDYGPVVLLVPHFMRRPYVMMLFVKDVRKSYLHQLTQAEIAAVARGWHDATWCYHHLMPRIGNEIAYNILTHNGPGTGLYFEFLPYTQTLGGLERMGLYICTELPEIAAERLGQIIQ